MSVYDRSSHVERTIESVLAQTDIELELVIVDDGSDNSVKSILNKYRSDHRIVIIEQKNLGLTQALIKGCSQASYEYIARIDAGDTMTENRLFLQSQLLVNNPDVGLVTSWVLMTTEEGYPLYEIKLDPKVLQDAVTSVNSKSIQSPVHASVMMRKSIYQQAGGYRSEFYFAQDCDLWARIAPICQFATVPEFLTSGIFSHSGISGRYASAQSSLLRLVAESNSLRQLGKNDKQVLNYAFKIRPEILNADVDHQSDYSALYFLARCLSHRHSKYAKLYWLRTISSRPWSVFSWINLIISFFYRRD